MGGPQNIKIPDANIYKIDGIKELEWVQDKLAKKGLKDPWLRNEVWRYEGYAGVGGAVKQVFAKGFKYGLAAAIATIALDKMFGIRERLRGEHGNKGDKH